MDGIVITKTPYIQHKALDQHRVYIITYNTLTTNLNTREFMVHMSPIVTLFNCAIHMENVKGNVSHTPI